MRLERPLARNEVDTSTNDLAISDVLKEAFVCISIPVVVFAFTYLTLTTMIHAFFG